MPDTIWDKITLVFQQLPGWVGYTDGIPYWFGTDDDNKHVWASVEPSGLLVSANMEKEEWDPWIASFKEIATKELGFKVQNADGSE
jgi:hypothetical protein